MATKKSLKLNIEDNTRKMLLYASLGSFLLVFTILSLLSLSNKMNFQNKLINKQNSELNILNSNISNVSKITDSYKNFVNTQTNLLGSAVNGDTSTSGNNAKLILDALPGEYDFPALATSLQNLLANTGAKVNSISTAGESSKSTTMVSASGATPIQVGFSVSGNESQIMNTLTIFEKSIRPFQFTNLSLSVSNGVFTASVSANTFYLTAQKFQIGETTLQ